jgi:acyl-CoA synthetase (AMP-forming)/AMP-acid ligase II
MNIVEVLARQAVERPNSPAIIESGWFGRTHVVTFSELHQAGARAASLLWRSGLRPGDAVLVFHQMSAELYVALIAIFRLNLIAMFLDPSIGTDHIEHCCQRHAPKALLASTKAHLLRLWSPALRRVPIKFAVGSLPVPGAHRWASYSRLPAHQDILRAETNTPALLTFTSGSTGQPKAALRSHGFLMAQYRSLLQNLELQPGEVDLTTLPIFLLANLGCGVTSLIPAADLRYPGRIDPRRLHAQIVQHRPNRSTASPALFERLARYCIDRGVSLDNFTKLFTGGAPVFPRLLDQMQAMAPRAVVTSLYGSTEAEPMSHVSRSEMSEADRETSLAGGGLLVGRPVDGLRLRIIRDQWGVPLGSLSSIEFDRLELPSGQIGEVVVSGEHVLSGYLDGQGDQETKYKVEEVVWHRTGDAGRLDASGRLWLLGRCVGRILDQTGTLYPFAVEATATSDERVKRAAIVAENGRRVLLIELYDRRREREPFAFAERLRTQVHEIRVVDLIPVDRRHNAKVDYARLTNRDG